MRTFIFIGILLSFMSALVWAVLQADSLGPADFTFSNGTEIKTVDPAQVTGSSEGRVVNTLMEGLFQRHPETLKAIPGSAESVEISEDKRTYTFFIRPEARWSNGRYMTAHDFVYSWRRMLHPKIASQYAFQLWYIEGAKKFNSGLVEVGDPVEVETKEKVPGALPFAENQILRGVLKQVIPGETEDDPVTYRVEDPQGAMHVYRKDAEEKTVEDYEWILYDFEKVAIRALDDRRFEVRLIDPIPYFLDLQGLFALYPVNRECVETHGYPAWTKPENLVGNGAFTLEFRRLRDRIRLRKNPMYWNRDAVRLETIDILASESATTNLNFYLTGVCDVITTVPEDVVPELLKRKVKDFDPRPFLATYYYIVNVTKPPMDNIHMRRALSMATDRREIVEKLTLSGEPIAHSMVPDVLREWPRFKDYKKARCPEFNPEEAAKEMALAGFPDGEGCPDIEILYNTSEGHRAIAELIQSQWKRYLGINITLRNEEWATFLNSRRVLNFQVARAGWTADYPDPNTFLDLYVTDGPQNDTGLANERYDALIEGAAHEGDATRRLELLSEAEQILMDELPVIPIYFYVDKEMVRPYVKGYYRNMENYHPLWSVWIDEEEKQRVFAAEGIR